MKYLRLALFALVAGAGWVRAQQEDEEQHKAPPIEIPDFSNLDEYIYEPKSTVTYGFRHLGGVKTSFGGQAHLAAPEDPGAATGANLDRVYHDGAVHPDARTAARLDSSGNPVIDPNSGGTIFDPIAPDGKTNTWNYTDSRQLTDDGYMTFHTYSADITDPTTHKNSALGTNGMELAVMRDMGKIGHTRLNWQLTAGMSLNDISSKLLGTVQANLNTTTDYYSLFGQTPPAAPYSSPSSSTTNVLDAGGNPVVNDDGTTQTVTTDTSVLIGNQPAGRTNSTTTDTVSVTNLWKLHGSYFTLRAGPTVWIPITSKFRASVSLGVAIIYAGSTYSVTESFTPDIGSEITETDYSYAYRILPGYYGDASLQYDLTDRAGFYAGAVFQSAGSYTQKLDTDNVHYSTKVDFGNQSGLRAGMTIRF